MPAYLIGVPYPELDKVLDDAVARLSQMLEEDVNCAVELGCFCALIKTEKKLSEKQLEEIKRLLIKRCSEIARKMSLLGKWE